MHKIKMRTFTSFFSFFSRLFDMFRGPSFHSAFKEIEDRLKEKVLLTVSISNNCAI